VCRTGFLSSALSPGGIVIPLTAARSSSSRNSSLLRTASSPKTALATLALNLKGLGREVVPEAVVDNVQTFFFLYLLIFATAAAYLSFLGLDLVSSISAVAATLGNVGPGLGLVGPMTNYAAMPGSGKVVLSLCMLLGRLELYTVLVVISTRFWR